MNCLVGQNKKQEIVRWFSWALVVTLFTGSFVVYAYGANGIAKPSVPEFTVELVAYPYDVAPVTSTKIDQYTGEKTVKTTPGYRVENMSIEITIKNQPFTPYVYDGNETNLYYMVRAKGHFGDKWEELTSRSNVSSPSTPVPSSSEYTVLYFPADYPDGAEVDFQVEAIAGYHRYWLDARFFRSGFTLEPVETSGWSSTQTVTISYENAVVFGEPETTDDTPAPDTPPTNDDTTLSDEPTSENPSDSQEQGTLELTWVPKGDESVKVEEVAVLVGIVVVFAAIAVGLFVYFRVRKH